MLIRERLISRNVPVPFGTFLLGTRPVPARNARCSQWERSLFPMGTVGVPSKRSQRERLKNAVFSLERSHWEHSHLGMWKPFMNTMQCYLHDTECGVKVRVVIM